MAHPFLSGEWRRNPLATGLIGLALGLLLAYGIGLWQRHAALVERDTAHQTALAAQAAEKASLNARLAELETALATADARIALLRTRLGVQRALTDLDQRNFGTANERLKAAATVLQAADPALLGIEPPVLAGVREQMMATHLVVASDLEAQRLGLLELAARLEALDP
ncbi:hypothetical protein [Silanimonas sp.]|uniref:hypothetical protein n=1 Tax=Silanimonas sp. TaxID=1929290 RepID=UPI001BBFA9E1|nr:hypothetical protein [Silanimonas sp.]MBS3896295.1 hypothetical protein [Silanimonas sp.]